jgi:hypothetical protein
MHSPKTTTAPSAVAVGELSIADCGAAHWSPPKGEVCDDFR